MYALPGENDNCNIDTFYIKEVLFAYYSPNKYQYAERTHGNGKGFLQGPRGKRKKHLVNQEVFCEDVESIGTWFPVVALSRVLMI
jgi:hypothetical protein